MSPKQSLPRSDNPADWPLDIVALMRLNPEVRAGQPDCGLIAEKAESIAHGL
jgi:hypothetical protein